MQILGQEITPQQQQKIDLATAPGQGDNILSDKYHIKITRADMSCLTGLQWLNDEIINFYFNLIAEHANSDGHCRAYPMSSLFYLKLMEAGYNGVRRWTSKIDLLAYDVILIPIHLGMHWCLAVIDCEKKEFVYYDSLGGRNQSCLSRLRYCRKHADALYLFGEVLSIIKSVCHVVGTT